MTVLTIIDENLKGESINTINLNFQYDDITLKDIIVERVKQEVEQYNSVNSIKYFGLVIPTFFEKTINKSSDINHKMVDTEKQIYIALDGFLKNSYFVFINNLQIDSLDEKLKISKIEKISFIKLIPLVGG